MSNGSWIQTPTAKVGHPRKEEIRKHPDSDKFGTAGDQTPGQVEHLISRIQVHEVLPWIDFALTIGCDRRVGKAIPEKSVDLESGGKPNGLRFNFFLVKLLIWIQDPPLQLRDVRKRKLPQYQESEYRNSRTWFRRRGTSDARMFKSAQNASQKTRGALETFRLLILLGC